MLCPRRGEAAARGHCKPFSSPFRILLQTRACCAPGFPPFIIIIFKITVMMGGGLVIRGKTTNIFRLTITRKSLEALRDPPVATPVTARCSLPIRPLAGSAAHAPPAAASAGNLPCCCCGAHDVQTGADLSGRPTQGHVPRRPTEVGAGQIPCQAQRGAKAGPPLHPRETNIMTTEERHGLNGGHEGAETIKDFADLGSIINSKADCSQEITTRLRLGRAAMGGSGKVTESKAVSPGAKAEVVHTRGFPVTSTLTKAGQRRSPTGKRRVPLKCVPGGELCGRLGHREDPQAGLRASSA